MSAPLKLTPHQVRNLGEALEEFTKITRSHNVTLTPYAPVTVGVGDSTLQISWDDESRQYVVDDRNGS